MKNSVNFLSIKLKINLEKSQRNLAVCRFPEWLQGGYSDVTINGGKFIYKSSAPESGSAVSYCIDADENRVAVFSETLWLVATQ